MHCDVILIPCEFAGRSRPQRTAVVVDVIRATSSIVSAFEHGCRSVLPAESADEARSLAASHPGALLCGEREGRRIEGFALGNSPREFTREAVAGKALILATSNGTRTLRAVSPGRTVAIGALMNRRAVAEWLQRRGDDALLICSGYEGIFSLEDAVCAGGIAEHAAASGAALGDGAEACRILWHRHAGDLRGLLRGTAWGQHILGIGLGADLDACARLDTTAAVPVLQDGLITAETGDRKP
jgi:2-phosphosulfolactate phosphatase